ncbi:transmembrane protein 87A-like [Musca domestica]|uniref:Transmembrane protein 87A-like n=1 Tax=Musca domestica TaxID=7370 RepID=A0A1I8M0M1_MUSDO|nr:transmembrane protein 87A-like [Musca domestica]
MMTTKQIKTFLYWVTLLEIWGIVSCISDPGITKFTLSPNAPTEREMRPLLANTKIYAKLECEANTETEFDIIISTSLVERQCWFDAPDVQKAYDILESQQRAQNQSAQVVHKYQIDGTCPHHLIVLEIPNTEIQGAVANALTSDKTTIKPGDTSQLTAKSPADTMKNAKHPLSPTNRPLYTVSHDGIYELTITVETKTPEAAEFSAMVTVEMLGPYGYISATDFPFLPFYGIMCIVYVIFGVIWLGVSFMQWRDLLRIQFWIGGVILLGMLEKAFFYAEYHSVNTSGVSVPGAELTAEFVSCAKRTLARMLVIIMSLGFGIVKPRLGPLLHRVVGVGLLYFLLACVESYLRVMRNKPDIQNELLVASIPLAVLDTGICWWIFTSLVQTTRTLRLRRNMVKLSLYRHFTNTLIFSVIASVIFMLYALRLRKAENCTPGWRNIWIDTAFWHILFSVLLLVIMILWRPTNNNQRYAFTPLLDNPEDEDDEEEDQFVADVYGVKMRGTNSNGAKTPPSKTTTNEEDDLRWVEENIPESMADVTLPALDSDEEIINTKFEVSKMQ